MGRYISTTGTAGATNRFISGNGYTAVANDRILCNSSGGAFSIYLPSSNTALDGDTVQVIDYVGAFATYNVTLLRNGSSLPNIMGSAADLVLNINYTSVTLTYTSAAGWVITGK
jgi:hypothetical protein